MPKQQIEKGELICMRGSFTLNQMVQNITVVTNVCTLPTCIEVHVQNVRMENTSFKQGFDVDLHPAWFRMCLPGKKLAKLEIAIVAFILTNPGCHPAQIAANVYTRKGIKDIKSAITRIRKKGFTTIQNYLKEV